MVIALTSIGAVILFIIFSEMVCKKEFGKYIDGGKRKEVREFLKQESATMGNTLMFFGDGTTCFYQVFFREGFPAIFWKWRLRGKGRIGRWTELHKMLELKWDEKKQK